MTSDQKKINRHDGKLENLFWIRCEALDAKKTAVGQLALLLANTLPSRLPPFVVESSGGPLMRSLRRAAVIGYCPWTDGGDAGRSFVCS